MFYYKVDLVETIKGSGVAPFVVLAYVNRLPDDSGFNASLMGDRSWFGWGQERTLLADLYDNITRLTEVTIGTRGGKVPKLERFPRPEAKKASSKGSRLMELHALFMGGMGVRK